MAAQFKTRSELQSLLLEELRQSAKCAELPNIMVTGPFPSRELNWDVMALPGSAAPSGECAKELSSIP
jgi:hypothetical protein